MARHEVADAHVGTRAEAQVTLGAALLLSSHSLTLLLASAR